MYIRSKILIAANKLFKAPIHPFNLQNNGVESYAEWQFERGQRTIENFLFEYSAKQIFKDKIIIDIGCGAAGKSLYYATLGARKVYGLEILEKYRSAAENTAAEKGLSDKFEFVCGDSAALPFESDFADSIIVNDAMEHVADPAKTICEMLRVLKPGGRIFINFPPYYHPMGAHLTDVIYIPWVQLFFPDKILIESYKKLVSSVPDGGERIKFRISANPEGEEYFSYINKMTIKKFGKILGRLGITPEYYSEIPLRKYFAFPAKCPVIKEMFIKTVVCVIRK